ncbi:MAG: DHA2 family efflux MFS transporter permease subunit [Nocardioides sp.]|nr:DHA2 family efflux MFS transporter permease subunit [Nocardioides sp.]
MSSTDRRWLALITLCSGTLMIVLDATIVNVALPDISADLGFSPSGLSWVVNAYLIAFGGLLLLAGRLGDLLGQRRVFLCGLAVFVVASLACAIAPAPSFLVAARLVQGVGGAFTSAVVLGMIVSLFPEPAEQAKAIGVYGFVASSGGSIGLVAGGVLTSALDWRWIFLVNVPVGVATWVATLRYVDPQRPTTAGRRADTTSAALLTAGLMTGVYTIVEVTQRPFGSTATTAALAIALLVGFVVRQAGAAEPLLPLRLFRSRTVTGANAVQGLLVVGMFGTFFLGALYFQDVRGYGPLQIGLAFLPSTVAMGLMSLRFAGDVTRRFGVHRTLILSLVLLSVGLVLLSRVPAGGAYVVDVAPALVLTGLGAGLGFPALTGMAMSAATPADSGVASGLYNTTVQVCGAVGLAVLSSLSTGRTHHLVVGGADPTSALVGGYDVAFLVAAGAAVAAAGLAIGVLRPRSVEAEPIPERDLVAESA